MVMAAAATAAAAAAAEEIHRRPDEPAAAKLEYPSPSPSRSFSQSRLHNFSFPTLSWGNQRLLRCMKLPAGTNGEIAGSPAIATREEPGVVRKRSSSLSSSPEMEGSKRNPPRNPKDREAGGGEKADEASPAVVRPWNLRSRRGACVAPVEIVGGRNNFSSSSCSPSPVQLERSGPVKSLGPRSEVSEKGERQKFSISLTREEVEEDFLVMKGKKPPRRPKKRARIVQKQLDSIFPGLWLSEITPDLYKVDA